MGGLRENGLEMMQFPVGTDVSLWPRVTFCLSKEGHR